MKNVGGLGPEVVKELSRSRQFWSRLDKFLQNIQRDLLGQAAALLGRADAGGTAVLAGAKPQVVDWPIEWRNAICGGLPL